MREHSLSGMVPRVFSGEDHDHLLGEVKIGSIIHYMPKYSLASQIINFLTFHAYGTTI